MRRFLLWFGCFFLIVVLAGAGLLWHEVRLILSPVSKEEKQVLVSIPKGASPAEIGKLLEDAKVIRSAVVFRYLVDLKKMDTKLLAGEHLLDSGLDTSGIMIIPLNKATHAHISRQFQERKIEKSYHAVVYGGWFVRKLC